MFTINTPEKKSKCWGSDYKTSFRGASAHWTIGYQWFGFGKELGPISKSWDFIEGRSWTRKG